MATPNVRLHPRANDELARLQAALDAEGLPKTRREDIVSALVYGTTAPQAAGMLLAFTRMLATSDE